MSLKLKNCSNCGRVFVDTGLGICRDCHEKEEEQMQEVSSYVRDHPHSRVKEIYEALGVKKRLVMRMIREGRFVMDGMAIEYPCERDRNRHQGPELLHAVQLHCIVHRIKST